MAFFFFFNYTLILQEWGLPSGPRQPTCTVAGSVYQQALFWGWIHRHKSLPLQSVHSSREPDHHAYCPCLFPSDSTCWINWSNKSIPANITQTRHLNFCECGFLETQCFMAGLGPGECGCQFSDQTVDGCHITPSRQLPTQVTRKELCPWNLIVSYPRKLLAFPSQARACSSPT